LPSKSNKLIQNLPKLASFLHPSKIFVSRIIVVNFLFRTVEPTLFKKYYDRGDLPISVNSQGAHRKVTWKLEPELLDYHLYLPIFFEGLRETEEPYKFLAIQGCEELLDRGGSKILPVLPQLIIPVKSKRIVLRI